MPKIGNTLRRIRNQKNYKQEAMAELLGMSQSNYSRIENNDYSVSEEDINRFAEKLNVSPHELGVDSTYTFNNYNNKIETQVENNFYHISPKIEKLYEDKIALLEEKVKFLETNSKS